MEASIFNIYSGQEGHFSSDEFCIFLDVARDRPHTNTKDQGGEKWCLHAMEGDFNSFFFYLKNTNRTTFNILIAGLE